MASPITGEALFFLFFLSLLVSPRDPFWYCHKYTSFGYGYRDFFEYKEANFTPDQVFYLEFYVRTSSDAHILLKSSLNGGDENVGYEIVIGGGSNTFTQIRYLNGETKNTMITRKTENYLSGIEYRSFWLLIDKLGILSVGRNDEEFINWRFDNPLPIKYFSFGSWTHVKADWRFSCNNKGGSDIVQDNTNIPPLRKLKNDLFTLYDPNTLPVETSQILEVKVNFQIHQVELNEKRGELTMHGMGDLKWLDRKVRWNPENYGGINSIYVPPFQIWTPSIRVLNSLDSERFPLFDLTVAGVMVKFDGSVFWRPPFKSVSTCIVDLKYWPIDRHNCSVGLGFLMEPSNLILTVMAEYKTLRGSKVGSEWEILEALPFNSEGDYDENYGILYVELLRLGEPQLLLFKVTYVVAVVIYLAFFWVSPRSAFKLHFWCGSIIILLLMLVLMGNNLPAKCDSAPLIMQIYSRTIVLGFIQLSLFCLLKNIIDNIEVPQCISKVLNNRVVSVVFCLPELLENEYTHLTDNRELDSFKLKIIIERLFCFAYLTGIFLIQIFTK